MKVKVRTKQGGFRDDRFHLTTKWQDVDEADISPLWVDSPNIEIKLPNGKLLPDSEDVPRPVMTRPEPAEAPPEEESGEADSDTTAAPPAKEAKETT